MKIHKQLSIFLDNRPGTLAKVVSALGKAKINILALSVADTVDHAVVRMVVNDPMKGVRILEEGGVLVIDREVLLLELEDRPGVLAALSRKLSAAKINIEYAYGTAGSRGSKSYLVLRTQDPRGAIRVLKK